MELISAPSVVSKSLIGKYAEDAGMGAYQWFLLGIMVAFTPSLLVLGLMLARCPDQPADTNHSSE